MAIKKVSTCVLQGLVISIRSIRYEEAGGFAVRITQYGKTVNWIYRFPTDRVAVLNAVLTQIGNERGDSHYRRR